MVIDRFSSAAFSDIKVLFVVFYLVGRGVDRGGGGEEERRPPNMKSGRANVCFRLPPPIIAFKIYTILVF